LQEAGQQYGFNVTDTLSYLIKGTRVSSTLIRDALNEGDLATAESMLGRNYSVCGRVVHGEKLGRKIGFPTANIQMLRKNTPIAGVFAVTMTGIAGKPVNGVANVGTRPTVDGDFIHRMTNMNHAICIRRTIVQNKRRLAGKFRTNLLV
jgi:riboflavin kinase/FMN adenylyltransferase